MRKKIIVALCSMLCIIQYNPIVTQAATTFSDITGYKYRESIVYLTSRDVVKGYPDGTFGPNRDITRAELVKIILEGAGVEYGTGENCFPDVKNDWFAPYVCYAKEKKLIKGYPDGTFKPNQKVTIAEGLKITLAGFGAGISEGVGSARAQPYIEYVHNNSIFSKYAIVPYNNLSRGNMAYLVHQLMLKNEGKRVFTNIRDVKSLGCGKPTPGVVPTSSFVLGQQRNYITVIGKKYNPNIPTKLIFAFHGRTNPNTLVRTYYKVEQASQGNAIIIYPLGLPEEGPTRSRQNPGDKPDNLRDYALFDTLVDEFTNNYCINKDQIFVVGHSLGAWFTNTLACARGDVIRAIGSVGGSVTKSTCAGPTAAVIMHHPKDNLASFAGGEAARDLLLQQNNCGPENKPVGPAGGNCVEYTNCQSGAPVIRCPHDDGIDERGVYYPHTWPDFAGQYIRDFFNAQP